MAHEKFTKEYWEAKEDIISAGVQGWNPLQRIPELLSQAFVDFKSVVFGFFVVEDLPERMSLGWEFVTKDMFNPDTLNQVLPARYGLEEVDGRLKWRDNFLMFMDKGFREKVVDARNRAHEEKYEASVEGRKYVSPHDPRGAEMAQYAESKLETHQVKGVSQEPPKKRGPGRPPKKK